MLYSLLITLYLLLFLILSIKNLKWAICWVVLTLPAYLIRFEIFGLPMTLLEGEILFLFLVWLIKNIKIQEYKNIKIWFKNNLFLYSCILVFLTAAIISMFISSDFRAAAGLWKAYFIEPISFLIVFVSTIKIKDIKSVLVFLCFSVFVLSLFAVYQKLTGAFILNEFWAASETRRVTSIYPYPNALALYLAPLITMFLGILIYKIKKLQITNYKLQITKKSITLLLYYFITVILGLLAVYFTKSKGALIAILAGIIFYAIFYKGYRKIFTGILIIIFITLLLYYFIISPTNWEGSLKGTATIEGGDSISTRFEMWDETWQMLKTQPLLGAGLAGYQTAVAPFHQKSYIEIYLYPHNIFLNFWTEIGLLGLISFILIIIWFYRTGFGILKQANKLTNYQDNYVIMLSCYLVILLAVMTTLLVHGLVDVPYFKNDLSIFFWILMGSMVILSHKNSYNDIFHIDQHR